MMVSKGLVAEVMIFFPDHHGKEDRPKYIKLFIMSL